MKTLLMRGYSTSSVKVACELHTGNLHTPTYTKILTKTGIIPYSRLSQIWAFRKRQFWRPSRSSFSYTVRNTLESQSPLPLSSCTSKILAYENFQLCLQVELNSHGGCLRELIPVQIALEIIFLSLAISGILQFSLQNSFHEAFLAFPMASLSCS